MRPLRSGPALCMLLVMAAVLSTGPWLEMGLNDDWSFAFIARGFAHTGHITYNGWAAPLLGLQALWGGALIRVFGFSFTLLRLSTLPFAVGCVWLLYRLGRAAGLMHPQAAFGALAMSLSPVFIPLATSFMTDVPALFFWLACFYCGTRAADEKRPTGWMASAALVGFAGGTIRQVVWVAPFLVLAGVAWLRRRERGTAVAAVTLSGIVAGAALACLAWYGAQAGHQPVAVQPWREMARGLWEPIRLMILATPRLILPVLVLYFAGWKARLRAPAVPLIGLLLAGIFVSTCVWWYEDDFLLGNMVTPTGVLWPDSEAMGVKPEILGPRIQFVLGVTLCAAFAFTVAWLTDAWRRHRDWLAAAAPLRRLLVVTVPSCAVYLAAVAFRYAGDQILFDRYLIFVTPPLVIALLWFYQERVRRTPSLFACGVIAICAIYGVAATHDYIAAARARLRAAERLLAAGIPRTLISAGLEFDGWTQLQETGEIPPLSVRKQDRRTFSVAEPYWFWRMTPAVDPKYVVVYSPVEGLRESAFGPVEYDAWLPPFRRRVLTVGSGK